MGRNCRRNSQPIYDRFSSGSVRSKRCVSKCEDRSGGTKKSYGYHSERIRGPGASGRSALNRNQPMHVQNKVLIPYVQKALIIFGAAALLYCGGSVLYGM